MTPKLKFTDGEKVLCFHGPLIYEAKCLKSSVSKEKHVKYFIHYAGWSKNWDEWVPESRVLKYNEANVQKQKEVMKAHSSQSTKAKKTTAKARKSEVNVKQTETVTPAKEKGKEKDTKKEDKKEEKEKEKDKEKDKDKDIKEKEVESRASTPQVDTASQDSGSDQPRKKRSRLDTSVEPEEQFLSKVEVKIKIPEELQAWLVDDWDIVTRQQKLVNLPAKLTAGALLDNYVAHKRTSKGSNQLKESVVADVAAGLKEYFDATLGSRLLYKFERPQYGEILQKYPDTPMSRVYGPIHLLRLFVQLGSMLAYTALDEKSMQHVLAHIRDLLKYMATNRTGFFDLADYGNATPEYHRKIF